MAVSTREAGSEFTAFFRDGLRDTNYVVGADGDILATAVQSDGSLVISGGFNEVNGQDHKHVARILSAQFTPDPFLLGLPYSPDGLAIRIPTIRQRTYPLEATGGLQKERWQAVFSFLGDGTWRGVTNPPSRVTHQFSRVRVE